MKTYLLDTFNRYKRYSEKLDAKTILCNKSWWVFNDLGEKETYIFQEDGTLIIALSGKVSMGTWQYLPVNQSVIISGNNHSYMVLPSFVDGNILALQIDGTNEYAFLIDENNKSHFQPNTYTEVIQYFENKEKAFLEAQLEAQLKEEQEKKRKLEEEQKNIENQKRKQEEELKRQAIYKERIIEYNYKVKETTHKIRIYSSIAFVLSIPLFLFIPMLIGIIIPPIVMVTSLIIFILSRSIAEVYIDKSMGNK